MEDPLKPDNSTYARMERLRLILQERLAERDRVLLQFGNTMLAWSHVEYWMYVWFRLITEMPAERSWRIFYSQSSFSSRADLLNAALSDQHPPTVLTLFIRKAIKKAKQYAVFRNMIAHGQPSTVPIRLTQTPPRCRVRPRAGIKVGIGRRLNPARDAEQRAEGVERVEPPVEAERELIEVGL